MAAINSKIFAKGSNVNVRAQWLTSAKIIKAVSNGALIGYLKRVMLVNGQALKWYEVSFTPEGKERYYVREDVATISEPPVTAQTATNKDGNTVVQNLIRNDYNLFHGLLRINELIDSAKKKGKDVSAYESQLKQLAARYTSRQNELKNSTALKIQTGFNSAYTWMKDKFTSLVSGIGYAQIIIPVAAALVGAGAAVAIYYTFKPKYDESTKDLKVSKDLEDLLSKAEPETATAIKADLEKQIDTAYNQGKTDGAFNILGMSLKQVFFIGAGIFVFNKYFNKNKK